MKDFKGQKKTNNQVKSSEFIVIKLSWISWVSIIKEFTSLMNYETLSSVYMQKINWTFKKLIIYENCPSRNLMIPHCFTIQKTVSSDIFTCTSVKFTSRMVLAIAYWVQLSTTMALGWSLVDSWTSFWGFPAASPVLALTLIRLIDELE